MSEPQGTPTITASNTSQRRGVILLTTTVLIVLALVFARFTVLSAKSQTEGGSKAATLSTAQPFATATPIPSSSNQAASGNPVAGVTPYPTGIVPGYPSPLTDNTALLKQMGNPDKAIIVSITGQYLQAWDHGQLVKWTYVTTGKPGLDTPTGLFHIFLKSSPLVFLPGSTDPTSIYFGYPSKTQYGMEFEEGGFYIHDAWWRTTYGPGLINQHWDPGRQEWLDGSHGCVNTPLDAMVWLFQWADLHTPVEVF